MDYLNFDLKISTSSAGTYSVAVTRSPECGEPSSFMTLPIGESTLRNRLQALELLRGSRGNESHFRGPQHDSLDMLQSGMKNVKAVMNLGRELFESLLQPEVRCCYRKSLAKAREQGKGLRLLLRIEPPELATLPWEFLYDEEEGNHLCLSRETPFIRYLALGRSPKSLIIEPPLRILGMISSPSDQNALDIDREKESMASAIDHLIEAGFVSLTWLKGQTWRDLQTAMRKGPWHVFHFIGHSVFNSDIGEGLLVLANEYRRSDFITSTQLGTLISGHQSMRLAVLNSCEGARASKSNLYSSIGAILTRRGIPAVVSMQYDITDIAALEFSRCFYDSLANGMSVEEAVAEARKAIDLACRSTLEWGTPVLHMHTLDGHLFNIDLTSAIFRDTPNVSKPLPVAHEVETIPPAYVIANARRGLLILLRKVKQFWIEGVLEKSLHHATMIEMGMDMMHGVLDDPWGSVLERPGEKSQPLTLNQSIIDIFDEQGGSLLILGEPGSGKTTTMLDLTRDLITRAENDSDQPIPVVLNLSSWNGETLFDWLITELGAKYQIPKRVSRSWLEESLLLPMLDGLDEVSADRRIGCVEAINTFTLETGLMGVIVCCRLKEYIELPVRLALNGAVRIQPLTRKQVSSCLIEAGPRLMGLQAVLQKDSALRIEARSPLMLNLMIRAYHDLSVEDLESEGFETTATRRKHLMDAYVARMFKHAGQGGALG